MKKLDIGKVNVNSFASALGIETTPLKLAINGPSENVEWKSIWRIDSIKRAIKLFRQARSHHRKSAIASRGLELCKTVEDFEQLYEVASVAIERNSPYGIRYEFELKYTELYLAWISQATYDQLMDKRFVITAFDSDTLRWLVDQEIISRCQQAGDCRMALRASQERMSDWKDDYFLLEAAKLSNDQEALAILKELLVGLAWLDPELEAFCILVQKAARLFTKP